MLFFAIIFSKCTNFFREIQELLGESLNFRVLAVVFLTVNAVSGVQFVNRTVLKALDERTLLRVMDAVLHVRSVCVDMVSAEFLQLFRAVVHGSTVGNDVVNHEDGLTGERLSVVDFVTVLVHDFKTLNLSGFPVPDLLTVHHFNAFERFHVTVALHSTGIREEHEEVLVFAILATLRDCVVDVTLQSIGHYLNVVEQGNTHIGMRVEDTDT